MYRRETRDRDRRSDSDVASDHDDSFDEADRQYRDKKRKRNTKRRERREEYGDSDAADSSEEEREKEAQLAALKERRQRKRNSRKIRKEETEIEVKVESDIEEGNRESRDMTRFRLRKEDEEESEAIYLGDISVTSSKKVALWGIFKIVFYFFFLVWAFTISDFDKYDLRVCNAVEVFGNDIW